MGGPVLDSGYLESDKENIMGLLTTLWHQPGSSREHGNLFRLALALSELLAAGVWHMESTVRTQRYCSPSISVCQSVFRPS